MKRLVFGLGVVSMIGHATPLIAQTDVIEEIVVVAHPLSGEGLSQATDVLEGAELERKKAANIGATLAQQPGIHSASFGNAVGRPVIHGLGGPRIRVMEDRIDTLDVSVTSADHAVSVEPFIAERIEVLKGSSTLLYGTGAIGGVVDVHTARIPHDLSDGLEGGIESRYNENYDGTATSAKLKGNLGQIAWHLDGTIKDGENYKIPGATESAALRAAEAAEDPGLDEIPTRGTLPGSEFDSTSYAIGASYIDTWGFVGLAISKTDAEYGLPGGHEHEEEEMEEEDEDATATLDLKQTRTDFELGVKDPFGIFTSLNVRVGHNDYEHAEIEPNGEVGTLFENDAWEARMEMVYETGRWHAAFGLQHSDKSFSAVGEEAFIPPVDTTSTGLFWVGERAFETFDLELGARIGQTEHSPSTGKGQHFNEFAASAGIVKEINDTWMFSLLADYTARAPVAEELYSDGPHLVTNAFEVGNPTLDKEHAANLSASLQFVRPRWQATATLYHMEFTDFIYQQANGLIEDDLPVLVYQQNDASFTGLDLEIVHKLVTSDNGAVEMKLMFDYVDASLDKSGNDYIPRTPPMRYGLGLDAHFGQLHTSLNYLRVRKQDNVADIELPTQAYDDLSAYVGFEVPFAQNLLTIFVRGKNLTDDEQRYHTSFIKDVAPAPGRSVEAGLRLQF
jgi:iron complex outermembrane recepter protein